MAYYFLFFRVAVVLAVPEGFTLEVFVDTLPVLSLRVVVVLNEPATLTNLSNSFPIYHPFILWNFSGGSSVRF
jgi:hypothetical protein